MNRKKLLNNLTDLNGKLKLPKQLSGVFLPKNSIKQFDFIFVAEMPSMNVPKNWDGKTNYNFDITSRDNFLQIMMENYKVDGSYVTDIVKERKKPGKPSPKEIKKWSDFLIQEIKIIKPKAIVILGKRTYEASFKPFIEPQISKEIKVDYVFHYCSQVSRKKFENRFKEVLSRIKNKLDEKN